jgi:hypothetical protein
MRHRHAVHLGLRPWPGLETRTCARRLTAQTIRSEIPFPHLELWEDGRRIPELYKPENFEWWYFDAQLADGRTLVLVFYIDQDVGGVSLGADPFFYVPRWLPRPR